METRSVKKEWSVAIRINHWARVIAIIVLTVTGFYIAIPFSILSGETTGKFLMGNVRFVHELLGILLVFLFIWRAYLAFFSRFHADWKDFFAWTDIRNTITQVKFYLLVSRKPPVHKFLYGPLQSVAYAGVMVMLFIITVTGLILTGAGYHAGLSHWAYNMLRPVETLLGGLAGVRWIHHICTWLFILFTAVHLYMAFWYDAVFAEGTLSSMICGSVFRKIKV